MATNMKSDEMQILKAVSLKPAEDVLLVVTYQYHVENNPATGKKDHSKSKYRWLARAYSIPELKKRILDLNSDAKRLLPWKWPDDPTWDGKIMTKDSTNYDAARWLSLKLSKALPWDEGLMALNGWDKKQNGYNANKKYDLKGFAATDGSTIDLDDKDAVLTHVGQTFCKLSPLKTQVAV